MEQVALELVSGSGRVGLRVEVYEANWKAFCIKLESQPVEAGAR
jgi:hypothetical protein